MSTESRIDVLEEQLDELKALIYTQDRLPQLMQKINRLEENYKELDSIIRRCCDDDLKSLSLEDKLKLAHREYVDKLFKR